MRRVRLSQTQIISLGFLLLILLGTALLSLPFARRPGADVSFTDTVFTAASASCVTGLVLRDTWTVWSVFGQAVILVLIQIGGLGFMTIATGFFLLLRRRIGLRSRQVLTESLNRTHIGGVVRLAGRILRVTAVCELGGAALLCIRFIPRYGVPRGLWYGVFHSVSAFCNAGFDLMGGEEPFGSFTGYADDPLVCLVLAALIVLGGLGFLVWDDVLNHGFRLRRYSFHSRVALAAVGLLLAAGTLLLMLTDGLSPLSAFFASVSARTAGFNTTDVGAFSPAGKLLYIVLMFIGGCPGSTAGGVKTTTVAVLVISAASQIRGRRSSAMLGRRLPADAPRKAAVVVLFNLSLILGAAFVICLLQPLPLADVLIETTSAVSTVGVTAGLTRALGPVSRYVVLFLMYFGRVGSLSFASALAERKAPPPVTDPEEELIIG